MHTFRPLLSCLGRTWRREGAGAKTGNSVGRYVEGQCCGGNSEERQQVRMLDCQGWWAEKEAPLLGGMSKGSPGRAGTAAGSYSGGCRDRGGSGRVESD